METLRFLNKETNQNERNNFSNWWLEQINIYGQNINYYSLGTSLSSSYFLYGEQPDAGFLPAQPMIVLLNLNNDSLLLSKFGIVADSDLAGVIHPTTYTSIFGAGTEPKTGDVIQLSEYGQDRLNYPKRGATVYQFTEVIDEFQGNPLGGHYVWFFKGKRYEASYAPDAPPLMGNNPLNDTNQANQASLNDFDYVVENPCDNTNVYGGY
jgi:hypothetical protein